jgi:hypothetical protein
VARIAVDGPRATDRETSGHVYYPHRWESLR